MVNKAKKIQQKKKGLSKRPRMQTTRTTTDPEVSTPSMPEQDLDNELDLRPALARFGSNMPRSPVEISFEPPSTYESELSSLSALLFLDANDQQNFPVGETLTPPTTPAAFEECQSSKPHPEASLENDSALTSAFPEPVGLMHVPPLLHVEVNTPEGPKYILPSPINKEDPLALNEDSGALDKQELSKPATPMDTGLCLIVISSKRFERKKGNLKNKITPFRTLPVRQFYYLFALYRCANIRAIVTSNRRSSLSLFVSEKKIVYLGIQQRYTEKNSQHVYNEAKTYQQARFA